MKPNRIRDRHRTIEYWREVGRTAFRNGKQLTRVLIPGDVRVNSMIKAGYREAKQCATG